MDWERDGRQKRRAQARRDEYLEALDERNKAKESATPDTKLALQLVSAYEGTSKFMLDLKKNVGRGAGLWRPTPKQAAIVIRITNDSPREG